MRTGREPYRRSALVLAGAALLGPFWSTYAGSLTQVTVGRVALLAVLATLGLDTLAEQRHGGRLDRPPLAAVLLVAALAGLVAWVFLNASTWGCFCAGGFQGFAEIALTASIATAVGWLAPRRFAVVILGAAAAGVLLGGLLAAVGLKDLHAGLYAPDTSVSRLDGVYGNANALAYAVSFALPVTAVATLRARGAWRLAAAAGLVATLVLLVLTYSRGGLMSAAVGVLAAVVVSMNGTRRRLVAAAVGVVVLLAAAGFVRSSFYEDLRQRADFGSERVAAEKGRDRSGWDASSTGLVPASGSVLSNPGGRADELRVAADPRGAGASFVISVPPRPTRLTLRFEARAERAGTPLVVGMAEGADEQPASRVEGTIGKAWKPFVVALDASADAFNVRFGAWLPEGGTAFTIRGLTVTVREGGTTSTPVSPVLELQGPPEDVLAAEEARFEDSRLAGVELALDALRENPVRGIGWERFTEYSAERDEYGALPTHNEYARFAAELGLPAVLLLLLAGAASIIGIRRSPQDTGFAMAVGVVACGAIGLLFINGLGISSASVPLALALGLLAGGAQAARRTR